MPRRMRVHSAKECLRAVVGTVVGDHLDQAINAVRSEERSGSRGEGDGGCYGLVLEGLGVGESGVAVDRAAQVGVVHALMAGLLDVTVVKSPVVTVGEPSDAIHVQVEDSAGVASDQFPRLVVVLPGHIEAMEARDLEAPKPSADDADAVVVAAAGGLEGDPACRPFAFSSPGVDEFKDLDRLLSMNSREGRLAGALVRSSRDSTQPLRQLWTHFASVDRDSRASEAIWALRRPSSSTRSTR